MLLWLKKLKAIPKLLNLKWMIESKAIFLIDSVLKTNPWTFKLKDLNGVKNYSKSLWERIAAEYIMNELLSRTIQLY